MANSQKKKELEKAVKTAQENFDAIKASYTSYDDREEFLKYGRAKRALVKAKRALREYLESTMTPEEKQKIETEREAKDAAQRAEAEAKEQRQADYDQAVAGFTGSWRWASLRHATKYLQYIQHWWSASEKRKRTKIVARFPGDVNQQMRDSVAKILKVQSFNIKRMLEEDKRTKEDARNLWAYAAWSARPNLSGLSKEDRYRLLRLCRTANKASGNDDAVYRIDSVLERFPLADECKQIEREWRKEDRKRERERENAEPTEPILPPDQALKEEFPELVLGANEGVYSAAPFLGPVLVKDLVDEALAETQTLAVEQQTKEEARRIANNVTRRHLYRSKRAPLPILSEEEGKQGGDDELGAQQLLGVVESELEDDDKSGYPTRFNDVFTRLFKIGVTLDDFWFMMDFQGNYRTAKQPERVRHKALLAKIRTAMPDIAAIIECRAQYEESIKASEPVKTKPRRKEEWRPDESSYVMCFECKELKALMRFDTATQTAELDCGHKRTAYAAVDQSEN